MLILSDIFQNFELIFIVEIIYCVKMNKKTKNKNKKRELKTIYKQFVHYLLKKSIKKYKRGAVA